MASLLDSIRRRIARATDANIYSTQHGMHGHKIVTAATGNTGTEIRFSALRASEETVIDYRDALRDVTFTGHTIPAGFEINGLIDSVVVTSGKVWAYYSGY